MVTQAVTLLSQKYLTVLPPYRTLCAVSQQVVAKNYKSQRYECVPLNKMRAMGMDSFDPLSHKNRKKDCDKSYYTGDDGKLHPFEEVGIELDLKTFRRASDIMLTCELGVGNLLNPTPPGEPDHMEVKDKIFYETLLQRFGLDPPPKIRMDFEILKANEIRLRSNIMLLLKDGYRWGTALAKLEARST